jgi:hypothetical protein
MNHFENLDFGDGLWPGLPRVNHIDISSQLFRWVPGHKRHVGPHHGKPRKSSKPDLIFQMDMVGPMVVQTPTLNAPKKLDTGKL